MFDFQFNMLLILRLEILSCTPLKMSWWDITLSNTHIRKPPYNVYALTNSFVYNCMYEYLCIMYHC